MTLYTPGPVTVPPRVLAAAGMPMLHHRSPAFHSLYAECIGGMQWLLGTRQDVLLCHTSGRGAMEACITNLLGAGDEIICICNGNFGPMFAKIAAAYGVIAHRVCNDWSEPFAGPAAESALADALASHPGAKAVTICHNDTGNSVTNDIRLAAEVAHRHGALLIVDAVSSAGCMPIEFDAWDIDALATASQKGLMSPAGISFAVLSDRAWRAVPSATLPKFFVNFAAIRDEFHKKPNAPETPGSAPVALVRAVTEALAMIQEEGREAVFARHQRLAAAVRAGLRGIGLTTVPSDDKRPSASVTTFRIPAKVSGADIRAELIRSFRIQIGGGLGQYKETTLRIGHMGHFHDTDALCVVGALEKTLHRLGAIAEIGPGITACLQEL